MSKRKYTLHTKYIIRELTLDGLIKRVVDPDSYYRDPHILTDEYNTIEEAQDNILEYCNRMQVELFNLVILPAAYCQVSD